MGLDIMMQYNRAQGKIPDRYWYQMNGKSAMENWIEQREKLYQKYVYQREEPMLWMQKGGDGQ